MTIGKPEWAAGREALRGESELPGDGSFHTPAQTDLVATELDQIQYETGEGPCVEAARNPGPAQVRSDDLAAEVAWPRFGPEAARRHVHAVLSVALVPDARPPRHTEPDLAGTLELPGTDG